MNKEKNFRLDTILVHVVRTINILKLQFVSIRRTFDKICQEGAEPGIAPGFRRCALC